MVQNLEFLIENSEDLSGTIWKTTRRSGATKSKSTVTMVWKFDKYDNNDSKLMDTAPRLQVEVHNIDTGGD